MALALGVHLRVVLPLSRAQYLVHQAGVQADDALLLLLRRKVLLAGFVRPPRAHALRGGEEADHRGDGATHGAGGRRGGA